MSDTRDTATVEGSSAEGSPALGAPAATATRDGVQRHVPVVAAPAASTEAARAAESEEIRVAWFTVPRVYTFLVAWLGLLAFMSLYISNPFWAERSAGATINFRHTMFLHGLLIGIVGLIALMVVEAFEFRSRHTRAWILVGTMVATVLASVGGILDRALTDTFALWTQIVGFFALDEILIVLVLAFAAERRAGAPSSRALPFWAAWAGSASMLVAAVMGHLAGWLLEFGRHSPFNWPQEYAHTIGVSFGDWVANLIGSHSHEMVIAVIATLLATVTWEYGYRRKADTVVGIVSRIGSAAVLFGTVAMTVIYVVAGFTAAQPPTLFTFGPGGANGLAGDDVVTGVFVLVGGLLMLTALLRHEPEMEPGAWRVRLSIGGAFLASVLTVVAGGFSIELAETFFGAGATSAPGAANDAVFTFWHQDFAFFLIPAVIALLWVADRYVRPAVAESVVKVLALGVAVAFAGGMIWVFLSPAQHGVGYLIASAGLLVVAYGGGRLWWGLLNERKPAHGG